MPTLRQLLGEANEEPKQTRGIIYARVSSQQQRAAGDLHRQLDDLKCRYPTYDVITDVGSGLNFRRPGLQRLLERVHSGMVTEVVVDAFFFSLH